MKTVSVIIPCYRDLSTLERAIKSVIAQTYSAIEIIVVNDCSPETEAIERIIQSYPRLIYRRNDVNLGLAGSRNAGIRIATGDYIALLDADDEYHPDKIAVQIAAIEPGVALTCGVKNLYLDGRSEKRSLPEFGQRIIDKPEKLLFRNTLNGAGILIERDLILRHGCYDASLRSCEDFDLWLRLLQKGIKIKDIGRPLYLYYANPAGLSKNFLNISKWEVEAICRYVDRTGEPWLQSRVGISTALVWLIRQIMRCELKPNPDLDRQVSENIDRLLGPGSLRKMLHSVQKYHLFYLPAQFLELLNWLQNRL